MRTMTKAGKIVICLVSIGAFLLSGCSTIQSLTGGGGPAPTQAYTSGGQAPQANIPVTGGPSVTANDQASDGSTVVVAKVVSKGPGWIAIHADQNGQIGPVIGYTHLNDGENDNVTVKIDPNMATPRLYAMLHIDAGAIGTYEFPGPDVPYTNNGQMISPPFNITKSGSANRTPSVTAKDQDASSGKVVIDDVVSNGPGWVDIHTDNPDGSMGVKIGYSAVHDGDNRNVTVTIDAKKASGVLHAMLHIDAGTLGSFDAADTTVMVNNQEVGATFKNTAGGQTASAATTTTPGADMSMTPSGPATPTPGASQPSATPAGMGGMVMATPSSMQPMLKVSNQQVVNGTVKIDDVVSAGPGWVVIYTVTNGQPDQNIGYTHVNDGDNPNVIVKIDTTKPVDTLYAMYHTDAGVVGKFEFPGPDVPVMLGVQMIAGLFNTTSSAAASTAPKTALPVPSITIQNQAIHNGAVVAPLVTAVGESWVAIHRQNSDGSIGDMIGFAAVHDGTTGNVVVHINTGVATRTMYAMLHVNVSKAATPQFPGQDLPVMVAGKMVVPAFLVNGPLTGDVPLMISKTNTGTPYVADGVGMSLYISLNDQPGISNCTGDCLKQFHPLLAVGSIIPADGISWSKIGVIILADHTRQITYNGSPLYYYVGDLKTHDINGQGLGGAWFLVTP